MYKASGNPAHPVTAWSLKAKGEFLLPYFAGAGEVGCRNLVSMGGGETGLRMGRSEGSLLAVGYIEGLAGG